MTQTSSDKKFAEALCHEKSWAKKQFQDEYVTFLTWTAISLVNYGIPREQWPMVINGTTFMVSDESQEAYAWLSEQAIRESCAYRGISDCSFETYIKGVLKSRFTENNWRNSKKDSGTPPVTIPGPKSIPECIRRLDPLHVEVFTALRYKKDINSICSKNMITPELYNDVFDDIVGTLTAEGYQLLIQEVSFQITDAKLQDIKSRLLTPPDQLEFQQYFTVLNKILEELRKSKRLLIYQYWSGLSVEEIFEQWMKNPIGEEHLKELKISSAKQIYAKMTKILDESLIIFEKLFPKEYNDAAMNLPKLKRAYRVFIRNWLYPEHEA